MESAAKHEAAMNQDAPNSQTALEEEYLPLPRIICRIPPMDAKPYATNSRAVAAWIRLERRVIRLFSRRF